MSMMAEAMMSAALQEATCFVREDVVARMLVDDELSAVVEPFIPA